jgi:DNA-binding MarR family transcriptional regulator
VKDPTAKPGHLARRFQQIAVAVFHAEVEDAGFDLTPVQYAALAAIATHPGLDQATLAGIVDRLAQKNLIARKASARDRRAHALEITAAGQKTLRAIEPSVEAAQRAMLRGLTAAESKELMRLMRKAIDAGNELSRAPMREASRPSSAKN